MAGAILESFSGFYTVNEPQPSSHPVLPKLSRHSLFLCLLVLTFGYVLSLVFKFPHLSWILHHFCVIDPFSIPLSLLIPTVSLQDYSSRLWSLNAHKTHPLVIENATSL